MRPSSTVTHQVGVGGVGVVLRERDVDSQGHTVSKDGHQDDDLKRSGRRGVKDANTRKHRQSHEEGLG